MNVLSLFDGISCGRVALERAGANVENYYASEIDTKAIHIAKKNYPQTIHLGDIEYWESWIDRLPKIDLVMGGSPCFVAGTLVNTINGQVPIEHIQLGDMCLAPDGNYYRVTDIGGEEKEIWKLRGTGIIETGTTENHPYLSRKRNDEDSRWKKVSELEAGDYLGIPIIQKEENPLELTSEECFILGRYIADGHTRKDLKKNGNRHFQLIISCGESKLKQFITFFSENHFSYYKHSQSTYRCIFSNKRLVEIAEKICGVGAKNKVFGNTLLNLPKDLLDEVLNGYMSGDGSNRCVKQNKTEYRFSTVSKNLCVSLSLILAKLFNTTLSITYCVVPDKKIMFDDREVNQSNFYSCSFRKIRTIKTQSFIDNKNLILWTKFKGAINTHTTQRVYNITVEESHTYTANNAIVHNCQGFSSNGKGLNFSDPRSKLFFTMVDIYKYIQKNNNPNVHFLLENVFMKKEWENVITNILGFEPVKINSELVGGALRSRNYWTDWDISIPENKGIVLQDLLESGLAYKRKADCIQASYDTGSISHSIEKSVNTLVAEPAQPDNTIESHNGSHRAFEVKDGQMVTWQMKKENHAGVRLSEKAIHQINLPDGWYTFRGFTPRELERLQTLPDFYCDGLDYAAIAHAVGNGWTVDVIKSIFDDLFKQHPEYLK